MVRISMLCLSTMICSSSVFLVIALMLICSIRSDRSRGGCECVWVLLCGGLLS